MKILVAPLEALTDPELTDQERRVLLALFSFRGKVTQNVWPSRQQLGDRANIKDLSAVGKRTTSLREKGWLVKFKKGFSGHMTYTLTFPERLSTVQDTIGQPLEVESTSNAITPHEVESTAPTRSNPPPHTGYYPPTALNKPVNKPINNIGDKSPELSKKFKIPTLEEVTDYCRERNNTLDAQNFIDFYSSKGWLVGKNKMKDWQACIRTWETNDKKRAKENANKQTASDKRSDYASNFYDYDKATDF